MEFIIVGKDWGHFASNLARVLEAHDFIVRRYFLGLDSDRFVVRMTNRMSLKSRRLAVLGLLVRGGGRLAKRFYEVISVLWPFFLNRQSVIVVSGMPSWPGILLLLLNRSLRSHRLILVSHGTDVRPMFLNGKFTGLFETIGKERFSRKVKSHARKVRYFSGRVDEVLTWRGCSHYMNRPVRLFEEVGFPVYLPAEAKLPAGFTVNPTKPDAQPTILHAATEVYAKGTKVVSSQLELVREAMPSCRLLVLEDVDRLDLLFAMRDATVVVDQAYSDNPYGVLAREASQVGTFVVVAGYSSALYNPENVFTSNLVICRPEELASTVLATLERAANAGPPAPVDSELENAKFLQGFLSISTGIPPDSSLGRSLRKWRPFDDYYPGIGGYASVESIFRMTQSVGEELNLDSLIPGFHQVRQEFQANGYSFDW